MTNSVNTVQSFNAESLRIKFINTLHEHWLLFIVEGIVLIALGFLAVIVAPLASLAVTIFIGWLFLFGGSSLVVVALRARSMSH
jgi:uncharacterized membrane protein HdeD (DUF308 family)